jgi:hypothetical protein
MMTITATDGRVLPSREFMDELYGELDRKHSFDPGRSVYPTPAYMRGYGKVFRPDVEEQHRRAELVNRGWY